MGTIIINGNNHVKIAEAICDIYGTTKVDNADNSEITLNGSAERDICMSEEGLEKVCEELSAKLGFQVLETDFEF